LRDLRRGVSCGDGRFRPGELGIDVPVGRQVVGELGLLASENRTTQTLERVEDGDPLTIGYGGEQSTSRSRKIGCYPRLETSGYFRIRPAGRRIGA
jgi:hypothetical protein